MWIDVPNLKNKFWYIRIPWKLFKLTCRWARENGASVSAFIQQINPPKNMLWGLRNGRYVKEIYLAFCVDYSFGRHDPKINCRVVVPN